MEAADFGTHIRRVCLVALGPLLNKVLQAVRVWVEGARVRVEGRVRVQVEGEGHLVPRDEVVAEDARYRTVPVGVWAQAPQAPNPSVDLGLDLAAEEALHKAMEISVPAVAAAFRREAFRRRAAFLRYRLLSYVYSLSRPDWASQLSSFPCAVQRPA